MSETAEGATMPKVETKGGVVAYLSLDGAVKAAEFYGKAFGAVVASMHPADGQRRVEA